MEKIPAACAMEWSIELERGLRSKKPGKVTEEISKVGSRLEHWSRESKVTVAECKMFGLIPGEDKLFLNAITLRLADAFRLGDKEIKTCIVKIFVEELKGRRKRRRSSNEKGGEGILSKNMLGNYLEILRRVKVVFDNGDVEERALALALFGCWADFAKDSADIRYVILSSLVSDHVLEVKASLFAAGCFSESADDFAYILLEILVNMLTSSETSKSLESRLGVGRAFARMSCFFPIANKAYKAGLKLVLDSCEEKFSSVMLISLTKIAFKWTMLIPGQIDLLLSFLTDDKALQMQATALHCLDFILARGLSSYPANTKRIHNLLNILHDSKFSLALLYKALKVLHKILLYNLPSFPTSGIADVSSVVLTYTEKMIQCSVMSKRLLAFRALADFSGNLLVRAKDSALAFQVISLIMDRISILVKSMVDAKQTEAEMEQEVTSLLNLVLKLVERHSCVGGLLLDKFCAFMGYFGNMFDRNVSTNKEDMTDQESSKVILKLILSVSKIMMSCLGKIEAVDDVACQALNSLKLLVENVHKSVAFDSHTLRIYFLLLQSDTLYRCMWRVMRQVLDFDTTTTTSPFCDDSFCGHELFSLECAKKIIEGRDYWSSYKAGKYAACQGSWSTSTFIFEQLMGKVQSDSCSWWLKSLTLLSRSESQIQRFGHVLSKSSLSGEGFTWKSDSCNYAESLTGLRNTLCVAKERLGTSFTGVPFSFQRWFLALRIKVLEAVLDITRLLVIFSSRQESSNSDEKQSTCFTSSQMSSQEFNDLVYSSREISYQLKKIAHEFDLFATSAIGMDRESMMIISALAMSCSLLAFCTTFALSIPLHASEKIGNCGIDSSQEQLYVALIQDLLGRLWHLDSESSQSLLRLLKVYRNSDSCFTLESRSQAAAFSCEGRVIAKLCRYAVLGIAGRQNESNRLCSAESLTQRYHVGLQMLFNIISKWMQIPFRCPSHYFQLRPYVSVELFAMNEDGENIDGKSVLSGSYLPLNVCLQLRNMPSYMAVRFSKLYCILRCAMQSSDGKMKEQSSLCINNAQIDDILDLNEKLLRYVSGSAKTTGIDVGNNASSYCAEDKYICFRPNGRYQGFSTCLLDISAFPVGVYQIKWHSCCVDSEGSYWSLLPQNAGPIFDIQKSSDPVFPIERNNFCLVLEFILQNWGSNKNGMCLMMFGIKEIWGVWLRERDAGLQCSSVDWKPSPVVDLDTSSDDFQVIASSEDRPMGIWLVSHGSSAGTFCLGAFFGLSLGPEVRCPASYSHQALMRMNVGVGPFLLKEKVANNLSCKSLDSWDPNVFIVQAVEHTTLPDKTTGRSVDAGKYVFVREGILHLPQPRLSLIKQCQVKGTCKNLRLLAERIRISCLLVLRAAKTIWCETQENQKWQIEEFLSTFIQN